MLNLNATPRIKIEHEETGASFLIKPISPRDNQKLLKRSKDKQGEIDYITLNGLVVDFAVLEWEGVGGPDGLLPPSSENKIKTGEKFPGIANFIYSKATEVKPFVDEVEEAKND